MIFEELVERALSGVSNELERIEIGIIKERLAERIKAETGFDLEGFTVVVDNFGVKHAYNRHGSEDERKHGQIPIEKSDFKMIPKIIYAADSIIKGGYTNIGKPTVLFEKELAGNRVVVLEVLFVKSKKKKKKPKLMFKTYYIKKAPD